MNEPLAACPHCAAPWRGSAEPDQGPATCIRCGRPFRIPPTATASGSGSGSGEHATGAAAGVGHVEVACPDCGAALRVRAKYLGRHVRCGGCHAKFRVPPDAPSSFDAPAAATPDPDDPWQGRAEVLRLLAEVAALRAENDGLRAQVERLQAEADRPRHTSHDDGVVTFLFLDERARASGS